LTEYRETAKGFGIEAVTEHYDVLKEMATIHLVAPERLEFLLTNTNLSKLEKNDFVAIVRTREDFKSQWIGKYVPY
jgi:hypothetical protein